MTEAGKRYNHLKDKYDAHGLRDKNIIVEIYLG